MSAIVPSILVPTFDEFITQAKRLEGIFDLAQIDVMDGEFVNNKSFDEIEKINDLGLKLNWELHLMVNRPIDELQKWEEVKNIKRVIFHIEAKDDPREVIAHIRGKCWNAGIAVSPQTDWEKIQPYVNMVDMVLFMTVIPGKQGGQFLPEVEEKIKQFIAANPDKNRPLIAVDGGISTDNIALVKSWGADVFGVGSVIAKASDIKDALKKLTEKL